MEGAEHAPEPGERLPAGVLDDTEGPAGALRLGVDDAFGGPGLDRDDADAVRDHVVQLAGDPQPFGRHRLLRDPGAHLLGVLAFLTSRVPDHPGDHYRHQDHGLDRGAHPESQRQAGADVAEEPGQGQPRAAERRPPRLDGGGEAEGHADRQVLLRRDAGRVQRAVGQDQRAEHQQRRRDERPAGQQQAGTDQQGGGEQQHRLLAGAHRERLDAVALLAPGLQLFTRPTDLDNERVQRGHAPDERRPRAGCHTVEQRRGRGRGHGAIVTA